MPGIRVFDLSTDGETILWRPDQLGVSWRNPGALFGLHFVQLTPKDVSGDASQNSSQERADGGSPGGPTFSWGLRILFALYLCSNLIPSSSKAANAREQERSGKGGPVSALPMESTVSPFTPRSFSRSSSLSQVISACSIRSSEAGSAHFQTRFHQSGHF